MDPTIVFALAIVVAPAFLVLATLTLVGAFIAALADGSTDGVVRRGRES